MITEGEMNLITLIYARKMQKPIAYRLYARKK